MLDTDKLIAEERQGLIHIKYLLQKFVETDEDLNERAKEFLENDVDDELLLQFIRGRKGDPDWAWDTMKNYSEAKFVKFPEMFPTVLPSELVSLRDSHSLIVLKARDNLGRRIVIFNTACWDINQHSLMDICKYASILWDKLVRDEDCMKNGLIFIEDCSGIGMKHCAEYTLNTIRHLIAVFGHAYPIQFKAMYFVNASKILYGVFSLAKLCLRKKLSERMTMWYEGTGYEELHTIVPKEVLPAFLKGSLNVQDALDPTMSL